MAKLAPIPNPADYGISSKYGFLPSTPPLTHLPNPYYSEWEAMCVNLPALVLTRKVRDVVHRLPVLTAAGLEHDAEWRRAYSLLCFMAHAYIWCGDSPSERIPPAISVPLLEVSNRLQIPPVGTYAAFCLWNFKPLFIDDNIDKLENLATLNTFTGSIDESWFYLISVAIEARGAPTIPLMLKAIAAARDNDSETVTRCLCALAEHLASLSNILQRMHENCEPAVFYHRVRVFLAGSKDMAHAGLPKGVIYDEGHGKEAYRQYSGGSNAQSSLIQFFDIVLGISHRPTGEKRGSQFESERDGLKPNFIQEMCRYMPGSHKQFLYDVKDVTNIRKYVENNRMDNRLCLAYDACLTMLSAFRDKHTAIVTRYIVIPSREAQAQNASHLRRQMKKPLNLAATSLKGHSEKKALKGTGGTPLIHFLKQAREETGEPAIGEWARRYMKRLLKAEKATDSHFPKTETTEYEDVPGKGLADSWTASDTGGICQF